MTTPPAQGWTRKGCIVSLLFVPLLAALPGCQAMNSSSPKTFDLRQSASSATRQLEALVPAGTPLEQATSTLQGNGFVCQVLSMPNTGFAASHLCTFTPPRTTPDASPTAAPTPIHWIATVDSADGKTMDALRLQREPENP